MCAVITDIVGKGSPGGGSGLGGLILLGGGAWLFWSIFGGGSHKGKGSHKKGKK